jgi:hypothetical protein
LLAFRPVVVDFKEADALETSGKVMSVPSLDAVVVAAEALFAMALGSNFPAYGTGDAIEPGVEGVCGEAIDIGVAADLLSISSRRLRVPAAE